MSKWMCVLCVLCALPFAGCAICSAPDDDAYGTYGGVFERADRYHGRVFSAIQPAGIMPEAAADEEELWFPDGTLGLDAEILPLDSAHGSPEAAAESIPTPAEDAPE